MHHRPSVLCFPKNSLVSQAKNTRVDHERRIFGSWGHVSMHSSKYECAGGWQVLSDTQSRSIHYCKSLARLQLLDCSSTFFKSGPCRRSRCNAQISVWFCTANGPIQWWWTYSKFVAAIEAVFERSERMHRRFPPLYEAYIREWDAYSSKHRNWDFSNESGRVCE